MPLRIAVVQSDEDPVFVGAGYAHDLRAGLLERRQAGLLSGREIDPVEQEVFVAPLVLNEQDLPGIR